LQQQQQQQHGQDASAGGARRTVTRQGSRIGVTTVAAVGLLICTGGPSTYVSIHYVRDGAAWRSWTHVVPFGALALFGVVALALALRAVPRSSWPWPIAAAAAYAAWALLSSQWSVSTETSAQAVTQIGVLAFACWFGWCLRRSEQMAAVVAMTTAAGVASALVARYQPRFNLMFETLGAWQGIFGNRNSLSPICVLGLLAVAGWLAMRPTLRRLAFVVPMAVVHVVLLRHSGGATATIALALIGLLCALLPLAWLLKRRGVSGRVVAAGAVVACSAAWLWVFTHIDDLAIKVGRDPTLTGRRAIWADVRALIADAPWHGYGYWAVWDRPDLTAATYSALGSYASAHNSWLEVLLGLGVVGLSLFMILCITAVVGVFSDVWRQPSVTTAWWCGVVVFVVAHNMMESFVLWHSAILVLLVASTCTSFGPSDDRSVDVRGDGSGSGPTPPRGIPSASEGAVRGSARNADRRGAGVAAPVGPSTSTVARS
jgi:O-antigen ligase